MASTLPEPIHGVAEATFRAGHPVRLITKLKDVPDHAPVRVIWFGPNNRKLREETNWTVPGEKALAFTAPDIRNGKLDVYRAEFWRDGEKVEQKLLASSTEAIKYRVKPVSSEMCHK